MENIKRFETTRSVFLHYLIMLLWGIFYVVGAICSIVVVMGIIIIIFSAFGDTDGQLSDFLVNSLIHHPLYSLPVIAIAHLFVKRIKYVKNHY